MKSDAIKIGDTVLITDDVQALDSIGIRSFMAGQKGVVIDIVPAHGKEEVDPMDYLVQDISSENRILALCLWMRPSMLSVLP